MDNKELLATAEERIAEHRKATTQLHFVDRAGWPIPDAAARIQLARHDSS